MNDQFVNIRLEIENLDRYVIRSAIFKAIKDNKNKFSGSLLDVGCGKMPYKDYILENSKVENYLGLDIESALIYDKRCSPDFTWNGKEMPFKTNSFNCAFATEVLEHCPNPNDILREIHRVLQKDGIFFFTVPFLWNLHEVPNDEYRYTPFSLERHLMESGFKEIEIKATGGWHASMAQMLGLWVRRSSLSAKRRKYLSFLLKPIIKNLVKIDDPTTVQFREGQMITGMYGTAKKKPLI